MNNNNEGEDFLEPDQEHLEQDEEDKIQECNKNLKS